MRIVLVTPELAPLSDRTGVGAEVAALAAALIEHGHEVRALLPLAQEIDPNAHSLARRLKPLRVEAGEERATFQRYDGRTPQGIEVHLLALDQDAAIAQGTPAFWRGFSAAAAEMLAALPPADTCCIARGAECAGVARHDRAGARAARVHLLSLDQLNDELPLDREALEAFDRIALGGPLADDCRAAGPSPLGELLLSGTAIPLPRGIPARPPVEPHHKASAKVELQTSLGLPVRADVPLVVFLDGEPDRLRSPLARFLKGDVQAVAWEDESEGSLATLAERYPDRLALVPDSIDRHETLVGGDACVVFDDSSLPVTALGCGTVPVAEQRLADGVVDLDPALTSGSAMLFDGSSPATVDEGLDRLVTAYHTGQPFADLSRRIQSYATPWPSVAELYLQLIQLSQ
jgi:hypothetical protein